jgi:hypothetical protein
MPGDCPALPCGDMVRPERFELPTCCSGGNRSIQLSYGRTRVPTVYMGGGNRFNANLASIASRRVRSTWTATFVPTIQAPRCIPRLSWPGSDVAVMNRALWAAALAGTVRSKLLSGESCLSSSGRASSGRAAHHHRRPGYHDLRGRGRLLRHRRRRSVPSSGAPR